MRNAGNNLWHNVAGVRYACRLLFDNHAEKFSSPAQTKKSLTGFSPDYRIVAWEEQ